MDEFTHVLKSDKFQSLATIIREIASPGWIGLKSQSGQKAYGQYMRFERLAKSYSPHPAYYQIKADMIGHFAQMMSHAIDADERLVPLYTTEVFEWLLEIIESEEAKAMLMMLLAVAFAEPKYFTPAEAAERTGKSESGWRNKCAAGEIIGAMKPGKQWLIPESVVIASMSDLEKEFDHFEESGIKPVRDFEKIEAQKSIHPQDARWILDNISVGEARAFVGVLKNKAEIIEVPSGSKDSQYLKWTVDLGIMEEHMVPPTGRIFTLTEKGKIFHLLFEQQPDEGEEE